MSYAGDINLGDTIDIKFTTRNFSTGAPFTLAGTPVISAYPGNSTTQLTAGITLTVDFDTVTGLNNCRVVATSGNGYAAATNYYLVITTGTVNSVSVVGEVIGSFSIAARSALRPTTASRTLDVTATGAAGIDWANVEGQGTSVNLSSTTTNLVNTTTTNTDMVAAAPTAAAVADAVWDETQSTHVTAGSFGELATEIASILADTGELQTNQGNWLTATGFSTHTAADVWAVATRVLTANTNLNDPTAAAIADAIWDELQSGHVTAGSFGEIATEIASILADTNELQTDDVPGLIAALNNLSAAQVNAEVVDALATDTYAEPGQGAPAATATLAAKVNYLYKAWRNRSTQTATTYSLYADDATTVDQKATVSDNGTTADKGEVATGP